MKTYKMSDDLIKQTKKGKIKILFYCFIFLMSIFLISFFMGEPSSRSLFGMLTILIYAIPSVRNTAKYHLEIDGNTLSYYKRGKFKGNYDLELVDITYTGSRNHLTLNVLKNGTIVKRFTGITVGVDALTEAIQDINAIKQGQTII